MTEPKAICEKCGQEIKQIPVDEPVIRQYAIYADGSAIHIGGCCPQKQEGQ